MFIKQLSIYHLNPETAPTTNQLETALAKNTFTEVSGLDWFSQGFVPCRTFVCTG